MPDALNRRLLDLNALYSEMGQGATDFDDHNSHDDSIANIIGTSGRQVFYQHRKDWHYRTEEHRWIALNDHNCWRQAEWAHDAVRIVPHPIR